MKFPPFRPSPTGNPLHNGLKTGVQVITFWSFFLGLVPWVIVWAQEMVGLPRFDPGWLRIAAAITFAILGSTSLYCAWLFVRYGRGTPLPLDETTEFLVIGPYRWIRNPMAFTGIFQGICVGAWLGSWPVMVYGVCGALVWNFVARPLEEADMQERFGQAYLDYQEQVPCWIPARRAYPVLLPALEQSSDSERTVH